MTDQEITGGDRSRIMGSVVLDDTDEVVVTSSFGDTHVRTESYLTMQVMSGGSMRSGDIPPSRTRPHVDRRAEFFRRYS